MREFNKIRRILKAQTGLQLSPLFPKQNLTYWDFNSGLIAFNNANLQYLNNITASLLGNPYMRSTGIPTAVSSDAELAARAGMLKLQQLQRILISNAADAVAASKNPEKAASLIATGKAEIVNGEVLKKPLLNLLLLSKIGGYVNQGVDFLGSYLTGLKDYSGKYGYAEQGVDQAINFIADKDRTGAVKWIKTSSDLLTYLGGDLFKLDNVDALDAGLQSIPGVGQVNALAGKKTHDFHINNDVVEKVGGAYTGLVRDMNRVKDLANKKVGLAGRIKGTLGKINDSIDTTKLQMHKAANIGNEASDRSAIATNMSDINHIGYANKINSTLDPRYLARNSKFGGKLQRVKKINFHKKGGEIKGTINLNETDEDKILIIEDIVKVGEEEGIIEKEQDIPEWIPKIIDFVDKFEEGGNIEWNPEILLEGGNIFDRKPILDLYKDFDLSKVNIIDSDSPRVEGDNIYVNSDEDLVHELYHYTSKNEPNELYKEFYSDLNDDRITKLGGNLKFVSRTGDPGDFYAPGELLARLKAAKYKSKGLNYTKDFFKLLRADENKYGYNMRDLLYMFSDENLEKLFNLESKAKTFLEGGKAEWNFDTWFNSIPEKNRANQYDYKLAFEVLDEKDLKDHAKDPENNHLKSVSNKLDDKGRYPFLKLGKLEDNPELQGEFDWYNGKASEYSLEDLDFRNNHTIEYDGDRYYYIPKKFKDGGKTEETELPKVEETTLKNVIPEGALHAHKHHMENAENLTKKGIPVVDNEGEQLAEIEREEWTMTLELTKTIEDLYKQFYSDESSLSKKDEVAIEAGKILVHEILFNTDDRTGLLSKLEQGGVINGTK